MKDSNQYQTFVDREEEKHLYLLELENGCYYIGQTNDPADRIRRQFRGKGSSWTQRHRPVRVVHVASLGPMSYKEAEMMENRTTIKYMKRYGWRRVRGGYFTNLDEQTTAGILRSHREKKTFGTAMDDLDLS